MERLQNIKEKISSITKTVPSDWAIQVSNQMQKSPESVRAYARGERGIKKGYPLQVLQHLLKIQEKHFSEIEQATK